MGLDRNSLLNARLTSAPKQPAPAPPKPAAVPKQQQQPVMSPNQILAMRRRNSPGPMPRRVVTNPSPRKSVV